MFVSYLFDAAHALFVCSRLMHFLLQFRYEVTPTPKIRLRQRRHMSAQITYEIPASLMWLVARTRFD